MENVAIMIYSLKGGGAERVVSLLSQELSKRYNLYLILFDSEDMVYSYEGRLIGIDVKSHNNIIMKIINVIRRTYYVKKIKKKYKIQYSISFLGSANIVNVLSRVDDKVIISIRSHLSKNKKSFLSVITRPINKFLYNKSDNIIAISNGVAKDLIKEYKLDNELISYIHNPINIKKINELSSESLYDDSLFENGIFTLINVGRLTNAKGQWHLIRALSYVKKEIQNVRLIILGQGELEDYLKKLVKELGLEDNIVFLGYKKNPFKYINKSDLFVFSSLYEGFGNVIIEAMACGIPIISTDCRSGPREILAPGTDIEYETLNIEYCEYGVLVPVCDGVYHDYYIPLTEEEKFLAISIIELYKDEKLRENYSYKSKNRARDFDISTIAKQWEKLID